MTTDRALELAESALHFERARVGDHADITAALEVLATLREPPLTDRLIEAQAPLQTGLGLLRLHATYAPKPGWEADALAKIESYLAESLAAAHKLLADLDRPMASTLDKPPAT